MPNLPNVYTVCMYIYIYICIYVCMYICLYICIYTYMLKTHFILSGSKVKGETRVTNLVSVNLFFYCKFHEAAQAILCNTVCNILTGNKSPELFDCLSNVGSMRLLFGLPDDEPSRI